MKHIPGTYLAFVIDDASRAKLITTFRPRFSKIICHHVTLDFNPTQEKLDALQPFFDTFDSGKDYINVYAHAVGEGIECLGVSFGSEGKDRPDGSFYHITLSLEPPHKPVESNRLRGKLNLCKGFYPITGAFVLVRK